MLFDYYSCLSFRQCADKALTTPVYKLNISNNGIVINSSTLTSTYPLDCNGIAIIRGTLTCTSDILYYNNISISSSINNVSTLINTLSGVVYGTTISGKINSISGAVNSISGLVATANTNILSISGLVATANTNITSISGRVATANNNITSISGQLNTLLNGTRIYQATQSAYVVFPSVTYPAFSTSMTVSNIPIGLYIAKYFIYVLNPLTTGTTTISNYQTSISDGSGNSLHYWNDCFPYTLTYSTTKTSNAQTFSQSTIINNTKVQNYTLSIGIFFTGNALYWGSSLSPLYSYFQLIKI